jgi:hypothetical protein
MSEIYPQYLGLGDRLIAISADANISLVHVFVEEKLQQEKVVEIPFIRVYLRTMESGYGDDGTGTGSLQIVYELDSEEARALLNKWVMQGITTIYPSPLLRQYKDLLKKDSGKH